MKKIIAMLMSLALLFTFVFFVLSNYKSIDNHRSQDQFVFEDETSDNTMNSGGDYGFNFPNGPYPPPDEPST